MSERSKQPILVMGLPRDIPGLLAKARVFVLNVEGNPLEFSTLDPIAADVTDDIKALSSAQTKLTNRTGKIGPRNKCKENLVNVLNNWGSQVMILVRNLDSYSDQVNLIHLFGGRVKVNGKFIRAPFELTNPSPGLVKLKKAKTPKGINEYQVSYDLGVTWDGLVSTDLCTITEGGFEIGARPFFRTRANIGLVKGKWIILDILITK